MIRMKASISGKFKFRCLISHSWAKDNNLSTSKTTYKKCLVCGRKEILQNHKGGYQPVNLDYLD